MTEKLLDRVNLAEIGIEIPDLNRITTALGSVANSAYSPPHDYPMSVPAFQSTPTAERTRPKTEKLRLYVHIPFCNYACSYCFFAKRVGLGLPEMQRYLRALKQELAWVEPGTPLDQLFMGGGTPTALPPELLDEVLSAIFERMPRDESKVHTVETSPESISPEHIEVLRKHQIGRVSMGIQTLEQQVLDTVNRRHSAEEALAACKLLAESGLIVNIDLIYGLPGQTYASFRQNFEAIASQGIHAFTLYNLRTNERTPITKFIEENERWNLERLISWRAFVKKTAEEFGFTQTRWHTFKRLNTIAAKHDRAPCFNPDGMGYQLGIGVSARSQLGYALYRNTQQFNTYLERVENGNSPVEETIPLNLGDRKTQFIARSIGDGKSLNRSIYQQAFGSSIEEDFGETIQRLHDNKVIEDDGTHLYLSESGKLVYDLVVACFYPQHAIEWLQQKDKSLLTA
ncbi:MAG: coproporphyrinogen-III oxidase family protein [Oscillatoria sp. PMC 1050.18]|nr:coproporphyrinogen-III oxidase family protein [Oscillatoria sp. PMC 1050.18]